jgi:hypothetical protein
MTDENSDSDKEEQGAGWRWWREEEEEEKKVDSPNTMKDCCRGLQRQLQNKLHLGTFFYESEFR